MAINFLAKSLAWDLPQQEASVIAMVPNVEPFIGVRIVLALPSRAIFLSPVNQEWWVSLHPQTVEGLK